MFRDLQVIKRLESIKGEVYDNKTEFLDMVAFLNKDSSLTYEISYTASYAKLTCRQTKTFQVWFKPEKGKMSEFCDQSGKNKFELRPADHVQLKWFRSINVSHSVAEYARSTTATLSSDE